jgi:CDGSH-type Zn-finger protein
MPGVPVAHRTTNRIATVRIAGPEFSQSLRSLKKRKPLPGADVNNQPVNHFATEVIRKFKFINFGSYIMSKENQYRPYPVEVEARRYSWCACGQSKKQPFCDGNHEETGMHPKVVTFTEKQTVVLCGCKATATPPFCDGSHKNFKHD